MFFRAGQISTLQKILNETSAERAPWIFKRLEEALANRQKAKAAAAEAQVTSNVQEGRERGWGTLFSWRRCRETSCEMNSRVGRGVEMRRGEASAAIQANTRTRSLFCLYFSFFSCIVLYCPFFIFVVGRWCPPSTPKRSAER